jgi:hypothetical protein
MTSHVTLETPAETRDRCKAHGAEWLGDRLSFRQAGASYKRNVVRGVFDAHGYGKHLPAEPKPEAQLKRAGREGRTPKGYITRPFVSHNPDTPMAIHITKVSGSDETGDSYDCRARVRIAHRLDPVTGLAEPFAVAKPPEGQTEFTDLTARDRAIWIANHCNVLLHEAQNKDLGLWIRSVYTGVGAAQALGGGNNYWVPSVLCDSMHALMVDLATRFGVHYERDPKTTLGAPHTKALFAQAAQRSLSESVAEMRDELLTAVEKSGGKRKRNASNQHQLDRLESLGDNIVMWKDIVAEQITGPMAEVCELYRQHFNTLIDGGEVKLDDDDGDEGGNAPPAPSSEGFAPASEPHAQASGEAVLAAAAAGDPDLDWLNC